MKDLPVRKENRLKDYDYSQNGAYFITICVKDRYELLGKIDVGEHNVLPRLSETGIIADTAIKNIAHIYGSVKVDKYVIMPNHIHMILFITENGWNVQSDEVFKAMFPLVFVAATKAAKNGMPRTN